jgi:tetratricopeptide (TPR) repeat protein
MLPGNKNSAANLMSATPLIIDLKKTFDQDGAWSSVIRALHHDKIIWKSLEEPGFRRKAMNILPHEPDAWSPAALSLLTIENHPSLKMMVEDPLQPLQSSLLNQANQVFREWSQSGNFNKITLGQVCLIALLIRDHRQQDGDWRIVREIFNLEGNGICCIFACLFGMARDKIELLQHLNQLQDNSLDPSIALHVLLSNPLQQPLLIDYLQTLFAELTPASRLKMLHELAQHRPSLASSMVKVHLDNSTAETKGGFASNYQSITRTLYNTELLAIADDRQALISSLQEVENLTYRMQADLAAEVAVSYSDFRPRKSLVKKAHETTQNHPALSINYWRKAAEQAPDESYFTAGYVLALIKTGQLEDAKNILFFGKSIGTKTESYHDNKSHIEDQPETDTTSEIQEDSLIKWTSDYQYPPLLVVAALLAFELGELDDSALLAKRAINLYENRKGAGPNYRSIDFVIYLADLLFNLNHHAEVIQLAHINSGEAPVDPDISLILAKSYILLGQPKEAITPLYFILSQQPDLSYVHRLLIVSVELSGEWEAAFLERQQLIDKSGAQSREDLQNLAYCALKANKPCTTIDICLNLLESNPRNSESDRGLGVTYWLLGEAEIANQDSQQGLEHLYRGREHDPGLPFNWTAISKYFSKLNEDIQAEEILRKASHALPNSPEIQLAIGKLYLSFNLPAKALPPLRCAKTLLESEENTSAGINQIKLTTPSWSRNRIKDQVLHNLGKTLRILGHIEEANHIFEEAFDSFSITAPDDPDSLYDYAQTLLLLGYSDKAIPLLEEIVSSQRENYRARLDLAKAMVQSTDKTFDNQRVISLLESVTAQPDPTFLDTRITNKNIGEVDSLIEAETLLAESYSKSGNYHRAAQSYKHALESPAANQPKWNTRLSLGLGSVALEMGEKEKAIAALQEGAKYDPKKRMLLQALERATSLHPSRADLYLRRGNAQLRDNDPDGALASFMEVASISDPRWEELYQTALNLQSLGTLDQAIRFFDLSVQRSTEFDIKETEAEALYIAFSETHIENSDLDAALRVINHGIEFFPQSVNLQIEKTKLLQNLNRQDEALDYINEVLQNNPEEARLHLWASELQFINENIPLAINHADQAIAIYSYANDDSGLSFAVQQAAELAFVQLQLDRARNLLDSSAPDDAPSSYKYLKAEIELFPAEDVAPLNDIITNDSHPNDALRWQATDLRIFARREGIDTALTSFANRSFFESLSVGETSSVFEHVAVGLAALELGKWEIALNILNQAADRYPYAPLVHYTLARAYVYCAETQQICIAAEIIAHAPGENVLSQETHQAYEKAIVQLEQQLGISEREYVQSDYDTSSASPNDALKEIKSQYSSEVIERIARLKARGRAAFQSDTEAVDTLRSIIINGSDQPEIIAAWILAQRASMDQEIIDKLIKSDPAQPLIWLYLAVAQPSGSPELAIRCAEKSLTYSINHSHAWVYDAPVLYGLLAKLAFRAEDFTKSQKYILAALDFWPDEPRWHSLAGDAALMLPNPDIDSARDHLEKAIQIDPTNTTPYLELGNILITNDNAQQAIQLLQSARRSIPEDPGVWLQLARAYQNTGDLEQASACVEHTMEKISDSNDPLLAQALILHGEIALQSDRPREALDRAKTLLHLYPENGSAYALLSRAYDELNQSSKALATLEKAIELTGDPYPLELDYLRLVQQNEGIDRAIATSLDLLTKYPHNPQLTARSADLFMEAGKWEEAILAAREALRTNSGELDNADQAHLHYLIGRLMSHEGQLDQAIFQLGQAIQLTPSSVESYLELGRVHLQRQEFDQAMKIYKSAMENAPNDPRSFYHAGMALKENRDYIQAEAMLRRATKLAPNDIGIHRMHGAVVVLNLVHNRRNISLDVDN